jgi:hypothetical protein
MAPAKRSAASAGYKRFIRIAARRDAASFEAHTTAAQDTLEPVMRDAAPPATPRGVSVETACTPLALRADPDEVRLPGPLGR